MHELTYTRKNMCDSGSFSRRSEVVTGKNKYTEVHALSRSYKFLLSFMGA